MNSEIMERLRKTEKPKQTEKLLRQIKKTVREKSGPERITKLFLSFFMFVDIIVYVAMARLWLGLLNLRTLSSCPSHDIHVTLT